MTIYKATGLYIGLSIAVSLLLLGIVALAALSGSLSLIEYSLIFVTAGPLFATILLSKYYFESGAPTPTWPQILTLTAISLPILVGLSIVIFNFAGYIMGSLAFADSLPGLSLSDVDYFKPQMRPLMNTTIGLLIGTLFIFPKQVEARGKKAGNT